MKTKILFVCLGNICRSPAAEGIMKSKVKEAGLEDSFFIDSAGTHGYHEGELPDPRMREHALRRGYKLDSHSRPVKTEDFYDFDLIVAMDDHNISHLKRIAPDIESQKKIVLMTDYCRKIVADHVPDPYYGGAQGFENVLDIIEDVCTQLTFSVNSKQ
ncbi:MAG: low molecular weight phosphotyrosine protein phosphatase [Bacteroidales bacterium]|nr:low molecular weight phosphotyrosine protein phosphatase [Bacteroidales bacterium]